MLFRSESKAKEAAATSVTTTAIATTFGQLGKKTSKPTSKFRQATLLIDKIMQETLKVFLFRIYDTQYCWYRKIIDPTELRHQISLSIRHTRTQMMKERKEQPQAAATKANSIIIPLLDDSRGKYKDNNQSSSPMMGLDPRRFKRFKMDDNTNNLFGGNCGNLGCL